MRQHPVRKIITDEVWSKLEKALAAAKHSAAGAPGEMTDREFLEAVLHLQRTGSPWRDLAPQLGYWHAIYMRFRRWEARGVWQRLWKNLQAEPFAGARGVLVDSTTVRAHPHAADAPKKTAATRLWAALAGASPPRFTRPRSTKTLAHPPASLVPSASSAVALHLTAGQAHDGRQFETLYESLDPENVLEFAALDKGYDADRIRERLALDGIEPVIPPIGSRCQKLPYDKELYRGQSHQKASAIILITMCTFESWVGRSLRCPKTSASATTSTTSKTRASRAPNAMRSTTFCSSPSARCPSTGSGP